MQDNEIDKIIDIGIKRKLGEKRRNLEQNNQPPKQQINITGSNPTVTVYQDCDVTESALKKN